MIIDAILNRKDGTFYNPKQFYNYVSQWQELGDKIAGAMDYGEEKDVQKAINEYIIANDYNPNICKYVNSQKWL